MPALTSLVDLMMATIGIFIIVFALQEVVTTPPLVPAPYDALMFCRSPDSVAVYRAADPPILVSVERFGDALPELFPKGGRVMLGVTPPCATPGTGGSTAIQHLIDVLDEANRLAPDQIDPLHRYELVPLGDGPLGEEDLARQWQSEQGPGGEGGS